MRTLSFLLASVTVVACSASGPEEPPPLESSLNDDNTASLNDGSSYLDKSLSDAATVLETQITFPASRCGELSQHPPGSVIVGDRQQPNTSGNNPDGFIRKVTNVKCGPDGVVVQTDPATLQDAFKDLKAGGSVKFGECKTKVTKSGKSIGIDMSGRKLFEMPEKIKLSDGRFANYTAYATLDEAYLCLGPKFDFKTDIKGLSLKSALASVTGVLQGSVVVDAGIRVDPNMDAKARAELAIKPISKTFNEIIIADDIPAGSISAGPISFPITIHYSATLSCDFSFTAPVSAKSGARETGTVTLGVKYDEQEGLSTIAENGGVVYTPVLPTFSKDGLMRSFCTITPKFEVKMLGVATGAFSTKVRGGMSGNQTCVGPDPTGALSHTINGEVESGMTGIVYAKLDLFGLFKFQKECTVFDGKVRSPYNRTFPDPGGPGATCLVAGPFPLPTPTTPNPQACFKEGSGSAAGTPGTGVIPGTCTHDVCIPGEKLGQACDACTMKVCEKDPYCCDTYWGASCFAAVQQYCGRTCL